MKATLQCVVGIVTLLFLIVSARAGANLQSLYRNERATIGDREDLWTNGTIYYYFDSSISPRLKRLLEETMMEWKNATCLLFEPREQEADYVKFSNYPNEEYCTCDSIGKKGGEQEVKLGYSCQSKGELLHTIGHVIGLWHEQARPDRDTYVQILKENIDDGQEKNFEKRNKFTIDYQGIDYDYESIMHLSAIAYSKNGSDTTKPLQGDFVIGQRKKLSKDDIKKVNTLYHCPSERVKPGKLQVIILNVTVYTLLNANPHVEVTAVDSNGDEMVIRTTERKLGQDDAKNTQPHESMEFPVQEPKDWQFFRIRVIGEAQENNQLAVSKTVHIIPGVYSEFKHCIGHNQNCSEYLEYGYQYIEDGNECSHNPCAHGICTDLFVDYNCTCSTSYYGDLCEHNRCEPNPCHSGRCELDPTNLQGYTCSCSSSYYGEQCQFNHCDPNPCQNRRSCNLISTNLRGYTCNCGNSYHGDLCQFNRCDPNPCRHNGICRLVSANSQGYSCSCVSGYYGSQCEAYDYCYNNPCQNGGRCSSNSVGYTCHCSSYYYGSRCERENECNSNPCQNRGRCERDSTSLQGYTCSCRRGYHGYQCQYVDSCTSSPCQNWGTCTTNYNSYTCSCRSGYSGTNCELRTGRLHLYIRYGSGLPDTDGWFAGDSDPYVKVIAYDSDGNSASRKTRYKQGDESPTWNEWLDFGTDTWTRFSVKVYDSDWGSDDSLSSWIGYTLNSFTSRTNVRMNCNSGYIIFDYYFEQ